jgi:hypothetical protein
MIEQSNKPEDSEETSPDLMFTHPCMKCDCPEYKPKIVSTLCGCGHEYEDHGIG